MQNSLNLIHQIERTHKGLGIPILFGNIACLAKVPVMYIGEKGIGKGTLIRAIKPWNIDSGYDMNFDAVTMQEMAERIGTASNKNMLWRIEEWSTLTDHHRRLFLTIGSKIISDKNYYHQMGFGKGGIPTVIDLKDISLVVMIGIQPLKFARMIQENENWDSLASDRFIKFLLYNPMRKETVEAPPEFDAFGDYVMTDISIDTPMLLIYNLLKKQVTEHRLPTYARNLLRAYSIWEGHSSVSIQDELDFCELFQPYLEGYGNLIYSADIEDEPHFAVGGMRLFSMVSEHEGITLDELKDKFYVYEKAAIKRRHSDERYTMDYNSMIKRHAQILIDRDMLKMTHNSPDKFYLSDKYSRYFKQIREVESV